MLSQDIISQAEKILQACRVTNGLTASAMASTNYDSYFTRDSVLNGLGLSLTGDQKLIDDLHVQLNQLRLLQGKQGQIPSNFKVSSYSGVGVSFGTVTPKLDGPSWYVIGTCYLIERHVLGKREWQESIDKALSALDGLEYNNSGLIYCPMGSDWADEYICEGYVAHIQLIRAWALKLAGHVYENERYLEKSEQIIGLIDTRFTIHQDTEDGGLTYIMASYTHGHELRRLDFATNLLYALAFPNAQWSKKILDTLRKRFLDRGLFPPAFDPQIKKEEPLWETLRNFHLFDFKNEPGHYHNGGAWWIWLGWYALALDKHKRREDILMLNMMVSRYFEKIDTFHFSEYITPALEEGGQQQMAFTASGLHMLDKIVQRYA